jgi:hypothetical protein
VNCLPGLALNHDPPDLSLPNRYNYRSESLAPGITLLRGNCL